jgi:DNA-binding beta-propeller fold protein YncE
VSLKVLCGGLLMLVPVLGSAQVGTDWIDLPSSKSLGPVPSEPQRVNSLPMSMAASPDGHYVVTVNAGYGTYESSYYQSLAVMDTWTGKLVDFPDERTGLMSKETLYSGLAFSADGRHVYASMASLTAPAAAGEAHPGTGVAVYGFDEEKITAERLIPIAQQKLASGRRTWLEAGGPEMNMGVPFPAAIAVVGKMSAAGAGERLLVADNLSDDVLLLNAATGAVEKRFDLSESDAVPGTYPVALAVSRDGSKAWVALWNASEVVELDLAKGTAGRKVALLKPTDPVKPGSHPCAMELSPDGKTLYAALANRDSVAVVDVAAGRLAVKGYFDTRLPGQMFFGAEPDAVAVSADGRWLYAANMGSDSVAVMDTRKLTPAVVKKGMAEPDGFIPTEWMPVSMGMFGGKLYVATAKGRGVGPNSVPQKAAAGGKATYAHAKSTYIGTLLYGSLGVVDPSTVDLRAATAEVMRSNRMNAEQERIGFAGGVNPIKHVLYVIKENRTYDQILGDLKQGGKTVGNGDPSMTMYGKSITPNEHKLALQFGLLDNFFDSGEVSGDGHVWSNAAIGTDYLEKTWQQNYRNSQRTYDYEGVVANGYPLLQKIPDVVEPSSGYMWGNADAHGKTHYNFGEYIASTFCNEKWSAAEQGPMLAGGKCSRSEIAPGKAIPAEWGGGVNKWPWAIPLLQKNVPTKPELVGHYAEESPDFNLHVPDQIRVEVFLRHLAAWEKDRNAGNDTMPNYITMRLGNDHTAGTTPGGPTPSASVADNDLALGRLVEAVSHSPYWDDTAIFLLEDDAQNGGDHVDAHRSIVFAVSKYAPHGHDGGAFVDGRFYTTVSVVRTMEMLLGLPPMNNNDALASAMGAEFAGPGDQAPYVADTSNRENGLIYKANGKNAVGADESAKMDFTHEDRADSRKLNVILWKDAMGDQPVPEQIRRKSKEKAKDDDD